MATRLAGNTTVEVLDTEEIPLFDQRSAPPCKITHAPTIHVVHGMHARLPFLARDAPLICISDWQFERETQRHFWEQACPLLEEVCGRGLRKALMLVAGDMASADDAARGGCTDAEPDLSLFSSCLGPQGSLHFVYGNHDEPVQMEAQEGEAIFLVPDGTVVDTHWGTPVAKEDSDSKKKGNTTEHIAQGVRLGGVHGIPASVRLSGWKKRDRKKYFQSLDVVCDEADIVLIHANPHLPCQKAHLADEDGKQIFDTFASKHARLLVHGHHHTREVVSVLADGRVVVGCDCRIVVFVPPPILDLARLTTPRGGPNVVAGCGEQWLRELLASQDANRRVCIASFQKRASHIGQMDHASVIDFCCEFSERLQLPEPQRDKLDQILEKFPQSLDETTFVKFASAYFRNAAKTYQ